MSQGAAWLSTLVVARILSPGDYGLVALAWLYVGFVTMLTEFGVGSAVVTMKTLSTSQIGQLHTVAVGLGAGAAAASVLMAAPAAAFFGEPRLAGVMSFLATTAFLSGFRVVPGAQLQRDLQCQRLAVFEGAQIVFAALANIVFAFAGWSYWALAAGSLVGALVHTGLVVRARPERFLRPHLPEIRAVLSFSRDVLVSRVSWYAYDNADFLVAGRLLGTSPLGAYRVAWTFASMPIDKIVAVVGRVTPGVLSAVQQDRAELRRYVLKITEATSVIVFPAGIGLALVAEDFIRALLGPKWLAAVAPLQVLSAYAGIRGIAPVWSQALLIAGESKFLMRVSIAGALLLPIGFAVGSRWGLVGIAAAWMVLHPLVVLIPTLQRLRAAIGIGVRALGNVLIPVAAATLLMAGAVMAVEPIVRANAPITRLAVLVGVGVAGYGLGLRLFAPRLLPRLRRVLSPESGFPSSNLSQPPGGQSSGPS